jgi:hypothetical protein
MRREVNAVTGGSPGAGNRDAGAFEKPGFAARAAFNAQLWSEKSDPRAVDPPSRSPCESDRAGYGDDYRSFSLHMATNGGRTRIMTLAHRPACHH